jgi:hypothetical protein
MLSCGEPVQADGGVQGVGASRASGTSTPMARETVDCETS